MSVGFYKITSKLVYIGGRYEALWLKDLMPNDDINDGCTKVYIDKDNIAEAVKQAKERIETDKLPLEFISFGDSKEHDEQMAEFKRITKELPKLLRAMLAKEKDRRYPCFEIEICW